MMQKENLSISEARNIVTETRRHACEALTALGWPVEEGTIDLDGKRLTKERVKAFEDEFDELTWKALRRYFTIQEEKK